MSLVSFIYSGLLIIALFILSAILISFLTLFVLIIIKKMSGIMIAPGSPLGLVIIAVCGIPVLVALYISLECIF